jgi:hypothetical protein
MAALGALAQNEASRWPRQRVFGFFYYLRDDEDGCALYLTEDQKTVYKVRGSMFTSTISRLTCERLGH